MVYFQEFFDNIYHYKQDISSRSCEIVIEVQGQIANGLAFFSAYISQCFSFFLLWLNLPNFPSRKKPSLSSRQLLKFEVDRPNVTECNIPSWQHNHQLHISKLKYTSEKMIDGV